MKKSIAPKNRTLTCSEEEMNRLTRLAGISPNTLRAYLRQYQTGGIDALKQLNYCPQESELLAHQTSIEDYFRTNPAATIKEAAAKIYELTGIQRSESRVRAFFKNIGIEYRKVGHIPAEADVEAQEDFKKKSCKAIFFVDAAHFVLAPFLGFLWSFTCVHQSAGRKRFNVLGACP